MEAMKGLFVDGDRKAAGATTLYIHANDAKQIAEVIRFKRAEDLDRSYSSAGWTAGCWPTPCVRTTSQ